jgi:hypothetical protein
MSRLLVMQGAAQNAWCHFNATAFNGLPYAALIEILVL